MEHVRLWLVRNWLIQPSSDPLSGIAVMSGSHNLDLQASYKTTGNLLVISTTAGEPARSWGPPETTGPLSVAIT